MVSLEDLEQARSDQPRETTEDDGGEAHGRQHEMGERAAAVDGQPPEPHAEERDQEECQPDGDELNEAA
jgi:hypothetical protein